MRVSTDFFYQNLHLGFVDALRLQVFTEERQLYLLVKCLDIPLLITLFEYPGHNLKI
jgi:hypothetical protein